MGFILKQGEPDYPQFDLNVALKLSRLEDALRNHQAQPLLFYRPRERKGLVQGSHSIKQGRNHLQDLMTSSLSLISTRVLYKKISVAI